MGGLRLSNSAAGGSAFSLMSATLMGSESFGFLCLQGSVLRRLRDFELADSVVASSPLASATLMGNDSTFGLLCLQGSIMSRLGDLER